MTTEPDDEDLDSSMSQIEHVRACAERAGARITSEIALLTLRLTADPVVE